MTQLAAQVRTKIETAMPATLALPAILVANTAALFAIDGVSGIPSWIKAAAALLLAF